MQQNVLKGYLLALIGVCVLSPDALLIRLAGDDPWVITAWRGILTGIMILIYNQWLDRRPLKIQKGSSGGLYYVNMVLFALSSFFFTYAITHANVTDVLVILAFTPLLSALLSAVFLHEQVLVRTWVATLVCSIGLAILFSQAGGQSSSAGLLAAAASAFLLATQFVIMRRCSDANLSSSMAFGALLGGLVCMAVAGFVILPAPQMLAVLAIGLIVSPISFVLFVYSLRYITAAETGLIMLLESVLGSLLVWLFLGEHPTLPTALAGLLILGTLSIYSFLTLRDVKQAKLKDIIS
ncbi:MAG: EamA family transporter [Thiolinea sp.]